MVDFSSITLDKQRPFGTVHPPEGNAHFCQDELYFDQRGKLVDDMLTPETRKRVERVIAQRAADAAAEKARRDSLAKAGIDPNDDDGDNRRRQATGQQQPQHKPSDIDLVAWARGEVKVIWPQVRKAFEEQYARNVLNARAAAEFLVDEGKMRADEVKVGLE